MMTTMETATVIDMDARRERGRRVARAIDMRRGLETPSDRRRRDRRGGRAWLNGVPLGGRDGLAYLSSIHD
ncbi:MAG: hypothetical protein QOF65_1235 [Thermoleophilaceae bacterium]|jgi:hypothetical protein|nr:hypothetical protein [Thermoleophilaceae bacterium]MEA2436679.1 hypothetical protein [Thermoleophilaceae bacterium]